MSCRDSADNVDVAVADPNATEIAAPFPERRAVCDRHIVCRPPTADRRLSGVLSRAEILSGGTPRGAAGPDRAPRLRTLSLALLGLP
ncbi:hypothetical protein [Streptomyces sp. NPDC002994]|uniref:hypothetical protein n=1 Tax=Streptomyces sp. NPDC002994 TaxID=3154441 RepID=UPI0033A99F98